jgi:DNA-binding ferritin-like protein
MGFFFGLLSGWNFFWSFVELIQKNVDEAAEKLKAKGIKVLGVVCHVSNAQQRKNLIETTVQVRKSASFLIVCK